MVRPRLEYSSTVWEPHHNKKIHSLEQVQPPAARFVHRNYSERTPGCVTNMVQSLGWESLQHRRYINRIIMLFKIQHGIIDISPDFIQPNDHRTRGSQRLRQLQATNEAYRNSFYPRTISDWNRLSTHVTDLQTLLGFRVALASLYALLIPMLHVHSFILGTWVILSDFIGHRSFIQGNLKSEEDYYPYLGRRRRRTAHSYFRNTLLAVNIGHA